MQSHPQTADDALAYAQTFQEKQVSYLKQGDLDGLLRDCYTDDARFHTFGFRLQGKAAIREVLITYLDRLSSMGARHIDKFTGSRDFIWLELSIDNPLGEPIRVYEFKFLREGKIYLQLFGLRQGTVWQDTDFPGTLFPDPVGARNFHRRYLQYHIEHDADGLADDFFTEDARLVTAKVDVSGQEPIRRLFRELFAKESGFTPLTVRNITSDIDYVWFEAAVTSSLGTRSVYDVMLLRDTKVCLQLVGQLTGQLPTDVAFQ